MFRWDVHGDQLMTTTIKLADMLESIVLDFRETLSKEIKKLGDDLEGNKSSASEQVKAFADFFKLIQGVEMISKGVRQQREQHSEKQLEVVEFRRELEAQIARLVDAETSLPVSGRADE